MIRASLNIFEGFVFNSGVGRRSSSPPVLRCRVEALIGDRAATSAIESATKDALALNTVMSQLFDTEAIVKADGK
jgi:hypothetical protein